MEIFEPLLTPAENRPPTTVEGGQLDDWAEIRHLLSTGKHSKRETGSAVGVSCGTVDRALESDRVPKYQRAAGVSSF